MIRQRPALSAITGSASVVMLLAASLLIPLLAAQTPAAGTAIIRGRVIAGDTGEPISGASVWVVSSAMVERQRNIVANSTRRYRTDDRGAFLIMGVPTGTCIVQALPPPDKGMYLPTGSVRGAPPVFDLTDGQVLDLDVVLPRAGAISGRIVDALGRPMAGVPVTVLASLTGGRLAKRTQSYTPPVSDDDGRYRAWGLPAGTYFVRADPDDWPSGPTDDPEDERFVRTYYPGVTSFSEAAAITLSTSEDLPNADIRVVSSRTFTLAGVVVDPGGRPVPEADVRLDVAGERGAQSGQRDLADGQGRFEFTRLVPGDYVLGASEAGGAPGGRRSSRPVALTIAGAHVRDARLTLGAGVTVMGEIVTDIGAPPPFDPAGARIAAWAVQDLERPFAPVGNGTVLGDWRFELAGIQVPVVVRLERLPPGWFVRAVTLRGNDILDEATDFYAEREAATVRVVVSDGGATLSGLVEDAAGRPAAIRPIWLLRDRGVLPAPWFSGSTMALSDEHGRFDLASIPPGDYFLLAVDTRPTAPPDDERLAEMLKLAVPITLGEQERREIRLRLVPWPY